MTVLVDTSAFYALVDAEDPRHELAAATLADLRSKAPPLVSHEYVLVETIALIQRRLGMPVLRRFVDDLLPLVEIVWVDPDLHCEARDALLAAGRRGVSLVDRTSFLVMRRRGIRRAFAFDPDFAAEGLELLPRLPPGESVEHAGAR